MMVFRLILMLSALNSTINIINSHVYTKSSAGDIVKSEIKLYIANNESYFGKNIGD